MCDKCQFLYTCIDPLSSPAENAADSKASERQRRTTNGSASSSRTYTGEATGRQRLTNARFFCGPIPLTGSRPSTIV